MDILKSLSMREKLRNIFDIQGLKTPSFIERNKVKCNVYLKY